MFDQGLKSPNRSQDTLHSNLKQQLYQNKLLTSDNKIKTQQLDILKDKIREQEDANTVYKKQIYTMEEKLRYYDEELKLKSQTSEEKSNQLAQNNYNLNKKNQQLQALVSELEDKLRNSELECSRNAKETGLVRKRLVEAEDQLDKAKDKKRQTVSEIERLSEATKYMSAENQDLNLNVTQLTQENRKLLKVVEENEGQIKKLCGVQQQYQELRLKQEDQEAELKALKHSYEVLKKKYDEVYYNYNVGLIAKHDEDSNSEKANMRIVELEQDLKHSIADVMRKDKEIAELKNYLREQDQQIKGQEIGFETEVKKVMTLIDGQTTSCEFLDQLESVAMRLLVENIMKQNREVIWLTDKTKSSAQEIKELKLSITKLTEEKNVLRSGNEELIKENNQLKSKIQHTVNDSVQNISVVQANFEERLRETSTAKKETEDKLSYQLQQKEKDIEYLQEILDATRDKLRKVEEDRDRTLEFVREQETEVKEFKAKFFHIAEETDHQKSKLNTTSYVLASLLKVLFNLMSKFDGLVHQKAFLSPYFNQYEKVKKKLAEMQLLGPKTEGDRRKLRIYKRFKRTTIAIIAALRLRKLQLKHSGTYYDSFDVRLNLPDCSEGLKRFIIDLFKGGKFVMQRELVSQVGEIMKEVNHHSEDAITSKLISAANLFNKIEYEPKIGKKRHITELHLGDLTSNFRLRDDFNNKLRALDGQLQAAEEYMTKQEEKFINETSVLNKKLEEVNQENETYLREKEKIQADHQIAKEQIDLLLTLVDEDQSILPASERRNRSLHEDYKILYDYVMRTSKKFQNACKELEDKNIRMIELERQTLYASYPENNFVHSTPHHSASQEKLTKIPGRIFSSGRKKNLNDY